MSGLLGLLDLGSGAYLAHSAGVATVGRNLANVETDGYSRETIDLRSELAAPLVGGVRAHGPVRAESALLASRERAGAGAFGHADALAAALTDAEARVTPPGVADVVDAIATLFAGIAAASASPQDDTRRAAVVGDAGSLASAFGEVAHAIADAQGNADVRVRETAARASALAAEIAAANRAIATSPDPVLADRRDLAAKQLAELTGAAARIDRDGMMRVTLDGGIAVVDGTRAARFEATPDPAYGGHLRVDVVDGVHRDDITTRAGGRIGGEIGFRDGVMARAAGELDQLAYDLATGINAVHAAHAGLDGVAGRDLFVPPAGVAGAAAALAVDPQIAADPRRLAGAAPGAGPGDSGGLLALTALAEAPVAGGGTRTFVGEAVRSIAALGADVQRAGAARELEVARADVLAGARDSLSGVSLEEEMARLSSLQRAAEAATRFVGTVDDMLRNLIEEL